MRAITVAAVLLVCVTSGLARRAQQMFRSGVQTVFVDVSVMKGHTPLTDLRAAEFSLTDNRVPQPIEAVAATAIPLDVSLVVDAMHTVGSGPGANPTPWMDIRRSVDQMAAALHADDRLEVLRFVGDVITARPMSPVASRMSAMPPASSDTLTDRYAIVQAVATALTAPVPPDRRHLVVVFAFGSGKPTVSPNHLVPLARRADALLYAVLPPTHHEEVTNRAYPFYPTEMVIRDAVTEAAEATGGKAYFTENIVGAFRDVLREFRASYMLRYTFQGARASGWHDIVVTVPSCPTCTIRARRGYMGQ